MTRTKLQKQRDKKLVSQLYLKGEIQADIAASVGLSQPTISRILAELQVDWRASALIDINEAKARELAKVDALEMEYWQAWKRSQEDAESEITKMQGGTTDAPSRLEKQQKREGQSGNPAFLKGVEWCINKRCEILGVDAPKKQEVTGRNGEPLLPKESDEFRSTILRKLDSIATATSAGGVSKPADGR